MDRKTKQALMGTGIAAVIVLILGLISFIKAITPSKEIMPLDEYYNVQEGQVAIILNDQIYEKAGQMIDGNIYVDYETVVTEFNHRFYWDSNENILSYTTPTEVIRAEVGSKDYMVNKSKGSVDYPIVKTNGDDVYIALEFVKKYSDLSYELFTKPDRVVVQNQWGEQSYATVKKATQVRTKASIKSPILKQVAKEQKLIYVPEEQKEKKFRKVMTEDGVVGYVLKKTMNSTQKEKLVSEYKAPEYTHIVQDNKINMVWHQVTNQNANYNILALLDGTKGVTTISPTWFSVSSNEGSIASLASESYVERAHNLGIEVWGLVDDFAPEVSLYKVLSSTSTREKLVNELIAAAIKYNLDGLNIDFEHINNDSAPHYLEFLRELSVKCRTNGIVLSVDNYPPYSYNAFYDLKEQGEVIDYVVIMAYDEYHSKSETAGSVSSIGYYKDALNNTLADVAKERIIMAMPFYTRVWKETTEADGTLSVTSTAYSMDAAWKYMKEHGAKPEWDETTGQYYAEFSEDGATYKCWLEEDASIEGRMKESKKADVAGVAGWRLGFEKPSVWNVIQKYVN